MHELANAVLRFLELERHPVSDDTLYWQVRDFIKKNKLEVPDFTPVAMKGVLRVLGNSGIITEHKSMWGLTPEQVKMISNWMEVQDVLGSIPGRG